MQLAHTEPPLAFLSLCIHLQINPGFFTQISGNSAEMCREPQGIHTMNRIEESQSFARLIPLQAPDEVPPHRGGKHWYFNLSLLQFIFSKQLVPGLYDMSNNLRWPCF